MLLTASSKQPPRNEHVHKRLRVNISKTLEPLTSPLESTKKTHSPNRQNKHLTVCSYVLKRSCYRTMDFAMAPSQNWFSTCTLFLQNKTYIIQKMTKICTRKSAIVILATAFFCYFLAYSQFFLVFGGNKKFQLFKVRANRTTVKKIPVPVKR